MRVDSLSLPYSIYRVIASMMLFLFFLIYRVLHNHNGRCIAAVD